jgi:hypothetical protein
LFVTLRFSLESPCWVHRVGFILFQLLFYLHFLF